MSDFLPIEKYFEESQEGSVHSRVLKSRCELCKVETTKSGHGLKVCLFTLMKRTEYLERKVSKLLEKTLQGEQP